MKFLFSCSGISIVVNLAQDQSFIGLFKQNKLPAMEINGYWSTDENDFTNLCFITSWEHKCQGEHLTAFAGKITKLKSTDSELILNWHSICASDDNCQCSSTHGSIRLATKKKLFDCSDYGNSPFVDIEALPDDVPSEFVSKLMGSSWKVLASTLL